MDKIVELKAKVFDLQRNIEVLAAQSQQAIKEIQSLEKEEYNKKEDKK